MRTERLFYSECYLREFKGRVIQVAESKDGFRVYLDRTAFYPESGGQPADRGQLGGIPVLNVIDESEAIVHVLAAEPAREELDGVIDWPRRFDHMQQHTGQHILSAAFERTCGYVTVSFHMGEKASTIDLNSNRVGRRQIEAAEELANQVIFEDRPVSISFKSNLEAAKMDLRKPTLRQGEVRLVAIQDFDLSACGGTHVSRTGGVGVILVRSLEQRKDTTRVEFVCGGRALKHARSDYFNLDAAARELSADFESVPAIIRQRAEEFRNIARAQGKLSARLTDYIARELYALAPVKGGRRIICKVLEANEVPDLKAVAQALVKLPQAVAIVGLKQQPALICFAQSQGAASDMSAIIKRVVDRFGGKGGGTRDFAQGGGVEAMKLDDALNYAVSLIE